MYPGWLSSILDFFRNELILAAFMVIVGLILCFAGYRVFKLYIAFIGFISGLVVGAYFSTIYPFEYSFLAPVFVGIVGAVVFWLFYKVGLFAVGAIPGYMVGLMIAPHNGIYAVALSILLGLSALFIERLVVILISSLVGAWAVIEAIYVPVFGKSFETILSDPTSFMEPISSNTILAVLWVILVITGIISQLAILKEEEYEEQFE
jgi:hypothetical protein